MFSNDPTIQLEKTGEVQSLRYPQTKEQTMQQNQKSRMTDLYTEKSVSALTSHLLSCHFNEMQDAYQICRDSLKKSASVKLNPIYGV